jgi:putative transcriptional regulator
MFIYKFDCKTDLIGKFVVSTHLMNDKRFYKTLVYICEHDQNGSIGIILNKAIPSLSFDMLMRQLGISDFRQNLEVKIHFGGPVEVGRGFVLHTPDYYGASTTSIEREVCLSATTDILKAIANEQGPSDFLLALGYAGWNSGQLEQEIYEGTWLLIKEPSKMIFDSNSDFIYDHCMNKHIENCHLCMNGYHV